MNSFKYSSNSGVTIVELLVSMVVGLIILSGVVKVVVDSKSTFLLEQEMAYIQENARFISDELGYEIRMAGYFGCNGRGSLTNALDVNPATDSDHWPFAGQAIKGYNESDSDLPSSFAGAAAGSEILTLSHGIQDDAFLVVSHNASTSTLNLSSNQNITKGDILIVSDNDCENTAIFQVSDPSSGNTNQIKHDVAGAGVSPDNCYGSLTTPSNGPYTCASGAPSPGTGKQFSPGSSILRYRASGYFIADSAVTQQPTLFRVSLVNSSGSVTTQAQELLTGVESMEVIYGVDNSDVDVDGDGIVDGDGLVNRYYTSDQITNDVASLTSNWVGWDRVITVQVTFILRSSIPVFGENMAVDLGDGDTFDDRFMRQKVRTTAFLRNRGA